MEMGKRERRLARAVVGREAEGGEGNDESRDYRHEMNHPLVKWK
jgi:hypothetical protein